MYGPFTDEARKVLQLANQSAQEFKQEYIGTEHLLLGLVVESGKAARILREFGISEESVKSEVQKLYQSGPEAVLVSELPRTPKLKRILDFAIVEAKSLGRDFVGTEHLLLGIFREEESVAVQIILNLNGKLGAIRERVLASVAD